MSLNIVLVALVYLCVLFTISNSVFISLVGERKILYQADPETPYYEIVLACAYDYDWDESIQKVYFSHNDRVFYTRGQSDDWVSKYDDSTISGRDTTSMTLAQTKGIGITLTNVTKNFFGDYRCKVDYYSELDGKSYPKDSYHKVSFGRSDNGTFWLDNYNSAYTYSSSLFVMFTSLAAYSVFGNNL
ncbi:unnamed protein product [Oppiella nova]|uniref:Uncharacterized protein n=1 Tax=Oppiella nova TaxID=334625 RepID=A0A7R9M3Q5_9ACAR|nr:unnamed protein product [Oppiella nova]CAG2169687.1 unnamed protein product [Oppiella nova]